MPGTVHGLDPVRLFVSWDQEHLVAELLPVPGGDPERLVVDQRSLDLEVSATAVLPSPHGLELVVDDHAARVPKR